MPKVKFADYNVDRMRQYVDVMFAPSVQDCKQFYPTLDGEFNLYSMRDLYRTFTAVCRVPGTDRFVDLHRDGIINGSTEHIEHIKSITLVDTEGGRGLFAGTPAATAQAQPSAKQSALSLRREQNWDIACESLLGRRLRRRPESDRDDRASVDFAAAALLSVALAPSGIGNVVRVDNFEELAAPHDASGDFQLTCTRCGEVRDVTFDMHTLWVNSRRKFSCRHGSYACQ